MKRYRVKVEEIHSDYVWIDAEDEDQAMYEAIKYAECDYEELHSCDIVQVQEIKEQNQ